MSKAIGMIEYRTVASGITAVDTMVKTSEVSIVEAQTVCPGKYIAIVTGDLSAVKAAVDAAVTTHANHYINSFVLGNPHESIFPAIYAATTIEDVSALGIVETYDATSIIVAADEAAKTAIVDLIELRIARGMCGKSYFMLTGEVSAVQAAVDRAKQSIQEGGMYADSTVIAHPDPKVRDAIL
ncbi:microcompartment protein CcmL/EutN [Lachnospiraceae bacterium PF1-21]|uniref:BMC domain-containing protein n=1 Tax=Ohessyouella blattaphilus TaxID=2949333 RepID=A0ABT1EE36_9FIRM|nr:BMC domain-containing protein [Ohessyouella blattaphilus]MCP1108940.1 BMC domain-containing protein [Ohessyouella blattaphilus]MCR8562334.1 BMC domain-containing protein [Ohessyouella blattaphilus]MDL2249888.1 BMC domain-containing protein [Lachnospiraceae bacterium OttesenSCG-928-J05]